jgi:hypothetical protein
LNEDDDSGRKPPAKAMPPKKLLSAKSQPMKPPKAGTPHKAKHMGRAEGVESITKLMAGIDFKTKEGADFTVDQTQAFEYTKLSIIGHSRRPRRNLYQKFGQLSSIDYWSL